MPLIPQQDVVTVEDQSFEKAIENLRGALESYPPVRIVTISLSCSGLFHRLVAVVETV